MMNVALEI